MKNFLKFVKNNVFLILAVYWFIDFAIGFITINPSTLDETTRKIKALELGLDLLFSLVFFIQHGVIKCVNLLSKRIDLLDETVGLIYDTIKKAIEASEKEKEAADKEEKTVEQK